MTTGQGIQISAAERQTPLVKNKKRSGSPKSIPQTDYNQKVPKGWARPDLVSLKIPETLRPPPTSPFKLCLDSEIEDTKTIILTVPMVTDFKPIDLPPVASVIRRSTTIESESVTPKAQTLGPTKLALPKLDLSKMEVQESELPPKGPSPLKMQVAKSESTPKQSIKSGSPQQNDRPPWSVVRPPRRDTISPKSDPFNYSGPETKEFD